MNEVQASLPAMLMQMVNAQASGQAKGHENFSELFAQLQPMLSSDQATELLDANKGLLSQLVGDMKESLASTDLPADELSEQQSDDLATSYTSQAALQLIDIDSLDQTIVLKDPELKEKLTSVGKDLSLKQDTSEESSANSLVSEHSDKATNLQDSVLSKLENSPAPDNAHKTFSSLQDMLHRAAQHMQQPAAVNKSDAAIRPELQQAVEAKDPQPVKLSLSSADNIARDNQGPATLMNINSLKEMKVFDFDKPDSISFSHAELGSQDHAAQSAQVKMNDTMQFDKLLNSAQKPTQASAQQTLTSDFNDKNWSTEVTEKIQWLSSQNLKSAKITLRPAELGTIEAQIKVVDNKTEILLTSQNHQVREALEQAIPRLREMFHDNQLNLSRVVVADQGSTPNQNEQQASHQQQQHQGHHEQFVEHSQQTNDAQTAPNQVKKASDNQIDYYA